MGFAVALLVLPWPRLGSALGAPEPVPLGLPGVEAPSEVPVASPEAARDIVYARPELDPWEDRTVWRPTWAPERGPEVPALAPVDAGLGRGLEVLLWLVAGVALAAVVAGLLVFGRELGPAVAVARRGGTPEVAFALDLAPESLPSDVPGRARSLWAAGARAEALGLLYRAALADLVHARALALPRGATEGDCLGAARSVLDDAAWGCLRELTRAWQALAYAHRPPSGAAFDALCSDWPRHFRSMREVA